MSAVANNNSEGQNTELHIRKAFLLQTSTVESLLLKEYETITRKEKYAT
jgi:hypothetical protein